MKIDQQMDLMSGVIMVAFAGKFRIKYKGGPRIPAWTHSIRVMLILQSYGYPPEVFLGGGSHDLCEDTAITLNFIREKFGNRVAQLTQACSLDLSLGDNMIGEKELMKRVAAFATHGDMDPLRIKIADSLDNNRHVHMLDADWAPEMLGRGFLWLDLARKFIPNEAMVEDFEILLRREKRLLG